MKHDNMMQQFAPDYSARHSHDSSSKEKVEYKGNMSEEDEKDYQEDNTET
jgi:hypothetical protein